MRILQCVTTLDPRIGGSVEAGRLLTIGMLRLGQDVEVVSLDSPGDASPGAAASGTRAEDDWPCTVHRLGPSYGSYLYAPRLLPWLTANAASYDAIVIHNIYRYIAYAAWQASRKTGIPYYLFTHGMLDPWFKSQPLKWLKKRLFWKLAGRKMFRDAAAVLYTAEDEKALAHLAFSPYDCNERVVGLGVADPPGQEHGGGMEALGAFRNQVHLPDQAGYLLFLGRVTPKKRVDLLIRAFAATFPEEATRLVIAGPDEGGLKRQYSRLPEAAALGERLIWTGHLDGAPKWAAIAGAEAMALVSHTENFGISLVEALAMGVPVLTTNKVNIWREIASGGAGLIDNDDLEGATRLLARWRRTDGAARQKMRDSAKQVFATSFAIDRVAGKLIAVLSEVAT